MELDDMNKITQAEADRDPLNRIPYHHTRLHPLSTMRTAVRHHWTTVLGIGALVALVVAVDPHKVLSAIHQADPRLLLLMVPCVVAIYAFRSITWWIELRFLGLGVSFTDAVIVTFISQLFVFLPGGDLWRVPIVKTQVRFPVESGIIAGVVVFDDLLYFFVLTLIMGVTMGKSLFLVIGFRALLVPKCIVFGILLSQSVFTFLSEAVLRWRWVSHFGPYVRSIGPTCRRLARPRIILQVICIDTVAASCAALLFFLGLAAVHAHVSFAKTAAVYAFGQVSSNYTVIPGALGVYEGLMTALIAVQGVSPARAAVGALLYRATNDVLMAVVGFGIALVTGHLHRLAEDEHAVPDTDGPPGDATEDASG